MSKIFKGQFSQLDLPMQPVAYTDKILIVSNPSFFYKKDNKNVTKPSEISESIIKHVTENYAHVVVLSTPFWILDTAHESLLRDTYNFKCFSIDGSNISSCVKAVLDHLVSKFSVKLSKKIDRTISWLRLEECISDIRVTVVGSNPEDYSKIGTIPDKELSFDDLSKIRQKKFVI